MAHSEKFGRLMRLVHAALADPDGRRPTSSDPPRRRRRVTRREFVAAGGASAAAFAASPLFAARRQPVDVAIVGAGIAGLACADELTRAGYVPVVYEASTRVAGAIRCGGSFPDKSPNGAVSSSTISTRRC